jgi:hypothetical protein
MHKFFPGMLTNNSFYVMASRRSFGHFAFENMIIKRQMFPSLNILSEKNDLNNFQCLTAKINTNYTKLDLLQTDCLELHAIICRKVRFVKPNCSEVSRFKETKQLELMLNPNLKLHYKQLIAYKKAEIKDMFRRLNMSAGYNSTFVLLWQTTNMCFRSRKIHSDPNIGSSQIRYCEWKGLPITCSAIFDAFPTDQGMCCTFNMKAADEIYTETIYRDSLQGMQVHDKIESYQKSTLPLSYIKRNEPKTEAGQFKGLSLILDTTSNQVVPGSYDNDFHGFTAVIESSGSFPLMVQEGLSIIPGFNNIITLTSSQVHPEGNMRDLRPNQRNCLFNDETNGLKIHKKYSYLNCKFECALFYSLSHIYNKFNVSCQPWFFPNSNNSISICDPWQSYEFFQIMYNELPDESCPHCLPDCSSTAYKSKVVLEPFANCDAKNLGVSQYCSLNFKKQFPMQGKLMAQIQNEYLDDSSGYFTYTTYDEQTSYCSFITEYVSSTRTNAWNVFKNTAYSYDSFKKDVAMVQINYKKSTLVQLGSQRTMAWIDYFSQVGGILGLLLGMGFVSFFEIVWHCGKIIFIRNCC